MENLYALLRDERQAPVGGCNWLGNLRWYAQEDGQPARYTLTTFPSDEQEGQWNNGQVELRRILCGLAVEAPRPFASYVYGADYLGASSAAGEFTLHMPWSEYGALLEARLSGGAVVLTDSQRAGRRTKTPQAPTAECGDGRLVIRDGPYTLAVRFDGRAEAEAGRWRISGWDGAVRVAVGFHMDRQKALETAERLFSRTEEALLASREHWEGYLRSCPLPKFSRPVSCPNPLTGGEEVYTPDAIRTRSLWHWWCALVNVSDLEFNRWRTFMAPDKPCWKGTWSNDGPETLALLSLTNQAPLVRACLVGYIAAAISDKGVHSWYTHASGTGCYGNPGDSGVFSHGVPNILHTVEFYVRQTGDAAVLDENAGGISVWEKLRRYAYALYAQRDINGDDLIEWANLWETGWDDKHSPFFARQPIGAWIEAVTTLPPEELHAFYAENRCPVAALNEQVFTLWAMRSMASLAALRGDGQTRTYCRQRYAATLGAVREKLWDEQQGFYFDWDERGQCLARFKNADAFYFLYFERDPQRLARMRAHLESPEEFALYYLPTASRDSAGFRADGYWDGGHWPREMAYVGMALHACGMADKAREILVRALMCDKGSVITENVNSLTGKRSTASVKMAYTALLNLALLVCEGRVDWCEPEEGGGQA